MTGAGNAVVSARGSKRLDQPGVRRIATGSRGEAWAWKAKKNWGEEGEKLMQEVWELGRYPVESSNRTKSERQLAERLRRALKDNKLSPGHVAELRELRENCHIEKSEM